MSVIPAVSYLPTGLTGCSVGPGTSRGGRKLARTPRVIKKKKNLFKNLFFNLFFIRILKKEFKHLIKSIDCIKKKHTQEIKINLK